MPLATASPHLSPGRPTSCWGLGQSLGKQQLARTPAMLSWGMAWPSLARLSWRELALAPSPASLLYTSSMWQWESNRQPGHRAEPRRLAGWSDVLLGRECRPGYRQLLCLPWRTVAAQIIFTALTTQLRQFFNNLHLLNFKLQKHFKQVFCCFGTPCNVRATVFLILN